MTAPPKDKINILVVDDLPEKLLVLESVLAELHENVVIARSGEEALLQVLRHEFAVVLLDVNMPSMDGYETAALIRKRRRSAHTPIIFITGYADELHNAQGYSLGAVDFILSPVNPDILRTKVRVFIDLFRMAQEAKRHADERVALMQEQAARTAAEAAREVAEAAQKRAAFLAECSAALASSMDPAARARDLARLPVPFLADLCAVAVADESGGRGELYWDGAPEGASLPLPLGSLPAPLLEAMARVQEEGRAERVGDLGGPDSGGGPPFALRAALLLPLRAREQTLGCWRWRKARRGGASGRRR